MVEFAMDPMCSMHPNRLWVWRPGVYVDDIDRTWVIVEVQEENCLQVLLRQRDVPLGEPVRPSQLPSGPLPVGWHLYPCHRYRCTNSNFWHIVYHMKICDMEHLLLELIPEP